MVSRMTESRFAEAVADTSPLVGQALEAYGRLAEFGVQSPVRRASITAGFSSQARAQAFLDEIRLRADRSCGQCCVL